MKYLIILLFSSIGLQASAENYFCNPSFFEQIGIKFEQEILCAKKSGNRIIFIKLKKQIKEAFKSYSSKISNSKDRYNNNKSPYLQQVILKDSKEKNFPVYFNKDGIGHHAKFFDNGADYFKDGLARVEVDDKIGFINKKGEIIIKPQYVFVSPFRNGYAKMCKDCVFKKEGEHTAINSEQWFYINKQNKVFPHPMKTIKLPWIHKYQKKIFPVKTYDNNSIARAKLKLNCLRDNDDACVNYAAFILEEKLSFDLGHFQYSISNIGHSQMISPDKNEISENMLISQLTRLCTKDLRICGIQGVAHYALGEVDLSFKILSKNCHKNDPHSCHFYGLFLDHQLRFQAAAKAFRKACTLKVNEACENKLMYKN
jgi:hypothetical protein